MATLLPGGRLEPADGSGEQVAVGVDLAGDANQVVVDVAEVACLVFVRAGDVVAAGDERSELSRCGVSICRSATRSRFIANTCWSSSSVGLLKIAVSSESICSPKATIYGKKLSTSASAAR